MSTIADLLEEIHKEPELETADHAVQSAEARLAEADLLERVLFELNLRGEHQGQANRQLFDDLWLYAWPVIKAFLRTNRMGQVLRRYAPHRYVSVSPEDQVVLSHSEEERDALALDVISRAAEDFRKHALIQRRWSPTGGAALRTWFIGTCAFNFKPAYRKWSRERASRVERLATGHDIDVDAVAGKIAARVPDPSTVAANRADLRTMIDKAQPMTKVILGLVMEGLTQAEIAAQLGLTTRAVEGRLYRFRMRVLDRRLATEAQPDDGGAE